MRHENDDNNVSPSVVFGHSVSERTSSRRRTHRSGSVQFSPYPLPKPADIISTSAPREGLPIPNLDILDTNFTTRRSDLQTFTPEAPSKNGRNTTPAPQRSFSTPSSSLIFQLQGEEEENTEEANSDIAVTFSHKNFTQPGEIIGTGSQGIVYKAFHRTDKRWYAIKVLKRTNLTKTQKDRLNYEIECVKAVSPHKNLLSYISAWESAGEVFLQMELCKESLEEKMNNWQLHHPGVFLPEETLWKYLSDLSSGLQQIHTRGFIHRDIKPGNVFVDGAGWLRIGDFGLLVDVHCDDQTEGDCRYLAKEVLLNDKSSPASDIFSLGATMFEIACLIDMPQNGSLWDRLRAEGVQNLSQFPSEYSPAFKNLVADMMAEDPANRPSADNILNLPQVKAALLRRDKTNETETSPTENIMVPPPPQKTQIIPALSPRTSRRLRSQSYGPKITRPIRALFDTDA